MARQRRRGREVKWLSHYSSAQTILVVGDGDLSFSLVLAAAFGSGDNLVATSLDSYDALTRKYGKAESNVTELERLGATILHGVDAKTMKHHRCLKMRRFDRIVFNFPHAGFIGQENDDHMINAHQLLVMRFFGNASHLLRPDGEIHVSHKPGQYDRWEIEELASEVSLVVFEMVPFRKEDYPDYKQKRGDGDRCDEEFPLHKGCTSKFCIEYEEAEECAQQDTFSIAAQGKSLHQEKEQQLLMLRQELISISESLRSCENACNTLGSRLEEEQRCSRKLTAEQKEMHVSSEEEAKEEAVVQKDQQGAASSSTGKKRSLLGPTSLPTSSLPLVKRPIVQPVGDRIWYVVGRGEHTWQVNGIIDVLLKKHFPGLVTLHGKEEPGFTWAHYQAAPDDDFGSKFERIKAEVWDYFTCLEGFEEQAGVAVENTANNILPDMKYEARIRAVIRFYGLDESGKKMKKTVACNKHLKRDEYLSVVPQWCQGYPTCLEKMVDKWCDPAWTHLEKRKHRFMMDGVSHRQGSLNLTGVRKNLEKEHDGGQVNELEAYIHGHKGKEPGQEYCSRHAKERVEGYTSVFREIHGQEVDPRQHPLDAVAVMKTGEGKKNGRFYLANGAIPTSSTPTLSQIRAQSTSSSSSIRSRPSPTMSRIVQLEAQIEE